MCVSDCAFGVLCVLCVVRHVWTIVLSACCMVSVSDAIYMNRDVTPHFVFCTLSHVQDVKSMGRE